MNQDSTQTASQSEVQPPHDLRIERAFIGALMCDPLAAQIGIPSMHSDDFFSGTNRRAFLLLKAIYKKHSECDYQVVLSYCTGTRDALKPIFDSAMEDTDGASRVETYIRRLKELAADRQAYEEAERLKSAALCGTGAEALGVDLAYGPDVLEKLKAEFKAEADGKRFAVKWPMCWSLNRAKALLPGSQTVFCGSAGASKSFFLVECIWRWVFAGLPASILCLEKGDTFNFRRTLAQLAENSRLTDDDATRADGTEYAAALEKFGPLMEKLTQAGAIQAPNEHDKITWDYCLDWLAMSCRAGKRVCIVDPMTIVEASTKQPWDEHKAFVREAGRVATKFGASFIYATHPKSLPGGGKTVPALENMSGGRTWREHVDTALWLDAHDPATAMCQSEAGTASWEYDRTLYLFKTRLGVGVGKQIAFQFDTQRLWHRERGLIVA